MLLTVSNGCTCIIDQCWAVHRLQKKVVERQTLESFRLGPFLWIDKLQLISVGEHQIGTRLRAYANPIDACWWKPRAVRLDRHLKAARVKRADKRSIKLQQRLSTCADDKAVIAVALRRPSALDRVGQFVWGDKTSAIGCDSDEIGVTK